MKQNTKILIVDDESKNLKILRIRLEKDYILKEASSGEQALQIIEEFKPALVLLDIMMEGMNGYEVAKEIKSNPNISDSKIILVTGKATIEEKLEGYHAGAEDYITKPFNGEELKAKVAVFIKLYNLESELKSINQNLQEEIEVRSQQLLKSERIAYIGMHAGEIVHNLKNPLTIIKRYIYKLKTNHPNLDEITKIDEASDKILEIIHSILTSFDRDIKVEMSDFLLSEVIEKELDFLKSLDHNVKYKIKTKLNLNETGLIHASKSHISQVIGNIIKNAVEAMHGQKNQALTISTSDFKDFVWLKIEDTGSGIDQNDLDRIFEPLFTTKNSENGIMTGNGLGLPFCKRMIETYGGQINISSQKNQGTQVLIKIPKKKGYHS